MLELICQQRYRAQGVPVDLSPYRNHGSATDTTTVGDPALGHDVIVFSNPDSQVAIGLGTFGAWSPLIALKVEVVARLNPGASLELPLVEGDGSFSFYVNQTFLAASVDTASGTPMYVRASNPVPANSWVTLGFYHDGFATMQLAMDGVVVGQTSVTAGVPPVQGGGVIIGNTNAGSRPLLGEVDEVRIWRLDPNAIRREFLCRHYSAQTAACWEAIASAVNAWAQAQPAQAAAIAVLINGQMAGKVRALLGLPPAKQAELRAILTHFAELWCSGPIDGTQMRDVLRQWFAALTANGVAPSLDLTAGELQGLTNMATAQGLTLDCDPAGIRFLQLVQQELQAAGGGGI
jgi:phage tail protein X